MPLWQRAQGEAVLLAAAAITAQILVDDMDNPVWETCGPAPNLAYLIGIDGDIVEAQEWYSDS